MSDSGFSSEYKTIQGAKLEIETRGAGKPLLVLPSEESVIEREGAFLAALAKSHKLIMPHAPGFGRSERPDWVSNPDDIAYMFLDLIEAMNLRGASVVGLSLGGWIALEMAVKDRGAFSKIALVDPIGVKIGGPFDRDIEDIWTSHPAKVAKWKWHDAAKGARDFANAPEEEVSIYARNIESFARFCWDPYMHNPKLKARLHRVNAPTLVLWGENDGLTKPNYGRAYAACIPGAKFETIAAAGHYPQIEQPEATAAKVAAFIG